MDEYMQMHPFAWGFFYNNRYISSAEQRNAEYTEPLEGEFTGNTQWAYFSSEYPPTPQIKNICGIECPDCGGSSDGEQGGDGGNNGGNDGGNTTDPDNP